MKILIISSAEGAETKAINDRFVKKLNLALGDDTKVTWHNYRDIGLEMDTDGLKAYIISSNTEIKDFDLVYYKSIFRYSEQAAAIAEYLIQHNVKFVGKELKRYIASFKLTQCARLARAGLPIPRTVYLPNEHYLKNYAQLESKLGKPFVFKAIDSSKGDDNYLITNRQQFKNILLAHQKQHFIAQSFVPNDYDLRILVVGNKPSLIIKRQRQDESSHLNNTSQGAKASLLNLHDAPDKIIKLAVKAHNLMGRDVSGVDLMLEKSILKPYILEVNASPQIGFGAFEEEKLRIYTKFFQSSVKSSPKRKKVGAVETIQFPDLGNKSMRARVDTGAQTSSIWASNIREKNGVLSFNIAEKNSPQYVTKAIKTKQFGQTEVTSSTGHTEKRYTAKFLVVIGGRRLRATFTLANRSKQVYPVLIGRNILRGKFTVDIKPRKLPKRKNQ